MELFPSGFVTMVRSCWGFFIYFFFTLIFGEKWVKLQDLLSKRSSELQPHPDQSSSLCLPAPSFPWEEIVSTLVKSSRRINEIVQKINQLFFFYIKFCVELDRLKWLWERSRAQVMLSWFPEWGQKAGLHFVFVKCHLCCDHTPKSPRWNMILLTVCLDLKETPDNCIISLYTCGRISVSQAAPQRTPKNLHVLISWHLCVHIPAGLLHILLILHGLLLDTGTKDTICIQQQTGSSSFPSLITARDEQDLPSSLHLTLPGVLPGQ